MLLRHGIADGITHSIVTKGQRGGFTKYKGTDRNVERTLRGWQSKRETLN